ncbi:hypothetical protein H7J77_15310 [Mycolicibacillus parakoreensis]|uniref:ABM domain-containing protein n=1 Tax=Mycolicibacillus parakoreensis TaxID=1069221 RepID=A0ABY3TU84_9MYCO|nr:hypothetical protein [Mycolicibacillus parakoreensis]MCV7316903.1 hypothetical protein [Mycolicibacillus parakoreensis]ULN51254.1 hypothetical protein MIU77_09905 [Mycolicibacillus parakoreensis]
MYARSTTIFAHPSRIDDGVAHLRDRVMPIMQGLDGYIGLSMLADRRSGRCIVTSSWLERDLMRASEHWVAPIRTSAASRFGGDTRIAEWEIKVLHRGRLTRGGAAARCTWAKADPDQLDRWVGNYRDAALPAMDGLDGFCSSSLLVDRRSGLAVSCSSFESREAMDRTRDEATTLRADLLRMLGATQVDVGEFELSLAHLRVPELVG